MLDLPVGDVAFEGFIHGRLIGREEERQRTRQFFHDILSSKLLVALLPPMGIYQSLVAKGAQEAEEQARVTKLLGELIDDICHSFAGQATRAEPIPEAKPRAWTVYLGPDYRDLAKLYFEHYESWI